MLVATISSGIAMNIFATNQKNSVKPHPVVTDCPSEWQIWEQHDADRDGWLTEPQLYDALRSVGIRLRKKEKHELRRELEDDL